MFLIRNLYFLPLIMMITGACSHARNFDQDNTQSAFKYREVYLPDAIGVKADSLGFNSLDKDWGIWGHNLRNVLPENPSSTVFAKENGNRMKNQFCFSSDQLFDYIVEFIDNNYGSEIPTRFSIIPNDNDVVCLCEVCVEAGNTKGDASPAVFDMIRRLSQRYPNHIFYTSDYRTTRSLPEIELPSNSGVMVSAITYPLTYTSTPEEEKFISTLKEWGEKTKRILVWEYINNFDDYFTPFPILGIMQNRLRKYRDNHVTAVFLNGSGEDASSFSKLKSLVLASLTADPDSNWEETLRMKARELYPVTGEIISGYLLAQEDFIRNKNSRLPLYEGMPVALDAYLDEPEFLAFHDRLTEEFSKTEGEERVFLQELLGELALTRLEMQRIRGEFIETDSLLGQLEALQERGIHTYSESGWRIENYVRDYRKMLSHKEEVVDTNKLKGMKLEALTPLDEDYTDVLLLTDGLLGLPSNYHDGHLITSPEEVTSIRLPKIDDAQKVVVWLSYNPAFKIYLPESVRLRGEGFTPISKELVYPAQKDGHLAVEFDLPGNREGAVVLDFQKAPQTRSMAIEEIEMY